RMASLHQLDMSVVGCLENKWAACAGWRILWRGNCKLAIANWELKNANRRSGPANLQWPILNLQFAIPFAFPAPDGVAHGEGSGVPILPPSYLPMHHRCLCVRRKSWPSLTAREEFVRPSPREFTASCSYFSGEALKTTTSEFC